MSTSEVPRLRRIRLMMLVCILVLAGFLGYWLRSEYGHEKEVLRKDFSAVLRQVNTDLDDSLIVKNFVEPIQATIVKGSDSAKPPLYHTSSKTGTFSYSMSTGSPRPVSIRMMMHRDSSSGPFSDSLMTAKRMSFLRDHPPGGASASADSARFKSYIEKESHYTSGTGDSSKAVFIYSNEIDSITYMQENMDERVTRGIRMLIHSLSEIPGAMGQELRALDSAFVRRAFQQALTRRGMSGTMYWVMDSSKVPGRDLLLDRDILHDHRAAVKGYESLLFSRTAPQILFSSFLLCLMALAFGMTYRALRSQMELATIRNDFISNMSHELKTPVSTVKVALEAISEPAVLENKTLAGEYLHMAGLELSRLELLINQALQSALLEGGRLRMEQERVDLRTLTDQMCRIMQGRFAQQNGSLTQTQEGADFSISGDALHLQGVIVNILDNALKYAGPEPQVELLLNAMEDVVQLRISDCGPGIAAQYRMKIFEKFFRVPRGNEHSVKGYGLGLNYAAEVVRVHRGTIRLEDRPGGGASFVLRFPKFLA